ncbi:MAG: FKBP-type peptidyl-prolyl cis-trans isomerase N-terminal domain-containing protein [Gammaproteobacteria bacterium]
MKKQLFIAIVLMIFSLTVVAGEGGALKNDKEKISYTIGFQIGQNLKQQGMDIDTDMLSAAIEDVMQDKTLKMTMQEMQSAMQAFQKKQMESMQAKAEENKKAGEAFLAENKSKDGVKVTDSGLQYKVITEGKGKKPTADSEVVVHYKGTLISGKEFDSSYKRGQPATFPVKGVIAGWTEALQLMSEGAKWQLYIPSDLAYGPRGNSSIGPNETLIFDVELISIK